MSSHDDELDAELRRLFADERLGLQPEAGAPEAIVAGARRIRRRRTALTSAGGVTMTVLVVAGVMTVSGLHPHAKTVVAGGNVTPAGSGAAVPTFTLVPPPDTSSTTAGATRAPGVTLVPPPVESRAQTLPPPPSAKSSQTSSDGSSSDTTQPFSTTAGPQLDPDGYGNLKLGMTEAEAEAQGVILTRTGGTEACSSYDVSGSGVPSPGAIAISINMGLVVIAPSAPVHTPEGIGEGASKSDVYATYADASENQTTGLSASASPVSTYRFSLDGSETVENVNLNSTDQDCAG